MGNAALPAKRLAYILAKTAPLHTLIEWVLPDSNDEEESRWRKMVIFGLREYCNRPSRNRRPHIDLDEPIKQILVDLISKSPSVTLLLKRAFEGRDRLLTNCVSKIPGLQVAYYQYKQSDDDDPFDSLMRAL